MAFRKSEKVVLIGNSHAAVAVIETLRREGFQGHLTLVSEENLPVFSPTALPYLFGSKEKRSRCLRPVEFYHGLSVIQERAASIDPDRSQVILESGATLHYDRLVLSTGASAAPVDLDGASGDQPLTLRRAPDLERIEKRAKRSRKILILGGGLIGLHLAEVLSGKGKEVLVLELKDQILPGLVHRELSRVLIDHYEREGIRIRLGSSIKGIHDHEAVLSSGESVGADLVLAAVGIRPNVEIVRDTKVAVREGILVNERMETNVDGVYGCGDVAEYRDFFTGRSRLNPNVISAAEQGKRAAESIMGKGEPHPGVISINTFRCIGWNLFSLGRFEPDGGDVMLEELNEETGSFKRLVFRDGTMKGMLLLNCPADGGVFYNLIRRQVPLKGMEERIFGDPLQWGKRLSCQERS